MQQYIGKIMGVGAISNLDKNTGKNYNFNTTKTMQNNEKKRKMIICRSAC